MTRESGFFFPIRYLTVVRRRDFLRWTTLSSAFLAYRPIPFLQAFGKNAQTTSSFPDLVILKDGSPEQMFVKGIQALGGMGNFIKKGQTVLVKPNIGWNKSPLEGANTNPNLVGKIVQMAKQAGAKKVFCTDHSVNRERDCFKRSGIEDEVKKNGGEMVSSDSEKNYRKIPLPKAKILKEVLVHELYLDCDVVINVPILKSHGGGRMTAAIKNLMGVVWDRSFWHRQGLHEAIAEFPQVRKPTLNIIDAFIVMKTHGPLGVSSEDLLLERKQILSTDIVLADTAASKVLGVSLSEIFYLKMASDLGLGSMELEKKNIERISISSS